MSQHSKKTASLSKNQSTSPQPILESAPTRQFQEDHLLAKSQDLNLIPSKVEINLAQNKEDSTLLAQDNLNLDDYLDFLEDEAPQIYELESQDTDSRQEPKKDIQANSLPKQEQPKEKFDYKNFLKTVPNRPGSYRMYDQNDVVIYVGKAKDLKKRLSSYFLKHGQSTKTKALVSNIAYIEFTVTFSESEALILENELIKQYQPRYNILLRDDKSYPYVVITTKERHPGIYFHRGPKRKQGEYFGPFPDSNAVKESLRLLQTIFPIRQCENSVYANRSRPCLMAQIGKCLAPCVPMSKEREQQYQEQVDLVKLFLKGKNQELLKTMVAQMEHHSQALEFEEAAVLRDQITSLRKIQESNSIIANVDYSLDVIGLALKDGQCCIHVLFIRNGRILGSRSFFPKLPQFNHPQELVFAFLTQFYLNEQHASMLPQEVIIALEDLNKDNTETQETESIGEEDALNQDSINLLKEAIVKKFNCNLTFSKNPRAKKAQFARLATTNAQVALNAKISSNLNAKAKIEELEKLLGINNVQRMECYDISHTMGELTVASCVVFNREGPDTSRYRRYNIEGIIKGDDYAAMHQVLTRRFKDPDHSELPQLIFIDGGKGQLTQAEQVLTKAFALAQSPMPTIVAVAKGEGRKAGLETLITAFSHKQINLDLSSPALQLVIHIRDEAHRFAITGHRHRRDKARTISKLETVAGVGAKRRQAILKHMGGMQEVMKASIDELSKVPGISKDLAQKIYDSLHSN